MLMLRIKKRHKEKDANVGQQSQNIEAAGQVRPIPWRCKPYTHRYKTWNAYAANGGASVILSATPNDTAVT
jgi:hypothetical protein